MDKVELTRFVKKAAVAVGFQKVGVAAAKSVRASDRIRQWLEAGRHGDMAYMADHFEKRTDPRVLFPGARSVVSVALNYFTPNDRPAGVHRGKISRYAHGDDYHDIVKDKLHTLRREIENAVPDLRSKCCVDTAPVPDKYWAVEAGIGWLGKHTNVITRELGSWVFLGALILDRELVCDNPIGDHCGRCRRCLDACPTNAFPAPYQLDATRCIAYWTIEYRGERFPEAIASNLDAWVFGCDICQDVCPWNRKFARPTSEPGFRPRTENVDQPLETLAALDEASFRRRFRGSPVKRAKWKGFLRNVREARGRGRSLPPRNA